MQFLRQWLRIVIDAAYAFGDDDGWALASHIALSTLLALFPFLIVLTALAGYVGSKEIADNLANILLEAWPSQVAEPLAREIHNVLTTTRGGVLTIGVVLSVYFASSGVDSLRIALNRAYNATETRSIWLLKLESIGYVLVAVLSLLALGFLIVLAPLVFATWAKYAPWLMPLENRLTYWRYGIAVTLIVSALVVAHKWLPAGRRSFRDIAPGLVVTLILWLATGILFGRYLAEFASNYVTMYAGLASAMIALVFLYWSATIFVYGGELNAAILHQRARKRAEEEAKRAAEAAQRALRERGVFERTMSRLGYEKRRR
ncbi:MAG TPA: YihY/virulence factor BrkB family protein [Xanthobacteraceae bacterium]|nr:YihY/virulence factor BrkB family protein [Xanthobacteraceae bacterium]